MRDRATVSAENLSEPSREFLHKIAELAEDFNTRGVLEHYKGITRLPHKDWAFITRHVDGLVWKCLGADKRDNRVLPELTKLTSALKEGLPGIFISPIEEGL